MTIYLIAREHEYETGNGSYYEDYVDEGYGYFTDKEKAEEFLASLRTGERAAHDRLHRSAVEAWEARQKARAAAEKANVLLKEQGLDARIPIPYDSAKPVMKEWDEKWSDYSIVEVEPA